MPSLGGKRLDPRYIEALDFAARLHDGQMRKGSQVHYLSHLLSVSALVMEHGGSEEEAIAALLHDSVEDMGDTYESGFHGEPKSGRDALKRDVSLRFGNEVLSIVIGCTDDEDHITGVRLPKDGSVETWRNRKQAYLQRLRGTEDVRKIRVSLADKLHNARCILLDYQEEGAAFWKRFTAGREEQIWYYGQLAEVFGTKAEEFSDRGIKRMSRELGKVIEGFS